MDLCQSQLPTHFIRYLYTEAINRRGDISLHKHFNKRSLKVMNSILNQVIYSELK